VVRDQVVARLDDVELGSRVREAQAAAAAAAGNAAQMEAEVLAARHGATQMERELAMTAAEVAAAREGITQAERDLAVMQAEAGYQESFSAREEQLHRSGAVSRQDVESARAAVASARAKVQAAEARVGQARATAVASQAQLEAARARLDQARAMEAGALKKRDAMAAMAAQGRAMLQTAEVVRDYVNIRTPRAGHVVKRLVAPGVLVQPGTAILKIAEIDRVRLQANVGERHLASIRVGSPVRVSPSGAGQPSFTARVTSVFPFVDPGGRTAVVEAVVDNPGRRLVPGQYVTMELTTGEQPDAVAVPRGAVSRVGGRATVWVVEEERVQPRRVTTGLEEPDRIEVREGLDAGEQVVARGLEGLYAGAHVVAVAAGAAGGPPGGEATAGRGPSPGPARGAGAPGGGAGGHPSHAPMGGGHATH
jgi:RND family efflux transporter MFP subunit